MARVATHQSVCAARMKHLDLPTVVMGPLRRGNGSWRAHHRRFGRDDEVRAPSTRLLLACASRASILGPAALSPPPHTMRHQVLSLARCSSVTGSRNMKPSASLLSGAPSGTPSLQQLGAASAVAKWSLLSCSAP